MIYGVKTEKTSFPELKTTAIAAALACDRKVVDWSNIREGLVQFGINTTDNIDILNIVTKIGQTVRGQRFEIDRFIGQNFTMIEITSPVISVDLAGKCVDQDDQALFEGENAFLEINIDKLSVGVSYDGPAYSATPLADTVSNIGGLLIDHDLLNITGLIEDRDVRVAQVVSET